MACLFCKIAAGEIPCTKVYEDELFIAFRDIQPKAKSHILLIPKKHIPTLNDLAEEDTELAGKWLQTAKKIAELEGLKENGYRTIINCNQDAGQEVFHIHIHILGGEKLSPIN